MVETNVIVTYISPKTITIARSACLVKGYNLIRPFTDIPVTIQVLIIGHIFNSCPPMIQLFKPKMYNFNAPLTF